MGSARGARAELQRRPCWRGVCLLSRHVMRSILKTDAGSAVRQHARRPQPQAVQVQVDRSEASTGSTTLARSFAITGGRLLAGIVKSTEMGCTWVSNCRSFPLRDDGFRRGVTNSVQRSWAVKGTAHCFVRNRADPQRRAAGDSPHPAGVGAHHRLPGLAREGFLKLRHVLDRTVHPKPSW